MLLQHDHTVPVRPWRTDTPRVGSESWCPLRAGAVRSPAHCHMMTPLVSHQSLHWTCSVSTASKGGLPHLHDRQWPWLAGGASGRNTTLGGACLESPVLGFSSAIVPAVMIMNVEPFVQTPRTKSYNHIIPTPHSKRGLDLESGFGALLRPFVARPVQVLSEPKSAPPERTVHSMTGLLWLLVSPVMVGALCWLPQRAHSPPTLRSPMGAPRVEGGRRIVVRVS